MFPALLLVLLTAAAQPPRITVSAAISLANALEEAAPICAAAGAPPVSFNFGGSNTLARQIVNGAPVDLFISADDRQMQVVEDAGAVARGTRVDLVGNRLAVVASPALASSIRTVRDLTRPEIRRIALGDPAAVPAGVYARKYLDATGMWDAIAPRVVPVANVRAALAAVDNGGADAAIVYESDTVVAHAARVAFVATDTDAPRIVYPAAIMARSARQTESAAFLRCLQSRAVAGTFRKYRFTPLPEPGSQPR